MSGYNLGNIFSSSFSPSYVTGGNNTTVMNSQKYNNMLQNSQSGTYYRGIPTATETTIDAVNPRFTGSVLVQGNVTIEPQSFSYDAQNNPVYPVNTGWLWVGKSAYVEETIYANNICVSGNILFLQNAFFKELNVTTLNNRVINSVAVNTNKMTIQESTSVPFLVLGTNANIAPSIFYSTDTGMTWNDATFYQNGTNNYFLTNTRKIVFNGNYWVAIGNGEYLNINDVLYNTCSIMHSTDGITWIPVDAAVNPDSGAMTSIFDASGAYGLSWNELSKTWVASGNGRNNVSFATSVDGLNWTPRNGDFTNNGYSTCVINSGSLWIAGGTPRTIAYSYDASSWVYIDTGTVMEQTVKSQTNDLAWNGSLYLACGGSPGTNVNNMAYSFNGLSWSKFSIDLFYQPILGIRWSDFMGQWVIFGQSNPIDPSCCLLAYSRNGRVWTRSLTIMDTPIDAPDMHISTIDDVFWESNSKTWILSGKTPVSLNTSTRNIVLTSVDGITWKSATNNNVTQLASRVSFNGIHSNYDTTGFMKVYGKSYFNDVVVINNTTTVGNGLRLSVDPNLPITSDINNQTLGSGSLIIHGGVTSDDSMYIANDAYVRGTVYVASGASSWISLSANNTGNFSSAVYANAFNSSLSVDNNALVVANGGLGVAGTVFIDSNNTSTNTTTGALVVPNGGAGIGGNVNIGGRLSVAAPARFGSSIDVSNNVTIGGNMSAYNFVIKSTVDSFSTGSGALTVPGGVGISKKLNIGGNVTFYAAATRDAESSTSNCNVTAYGSLGVKSGVCVDGNMLISNLRTALSVVTPTSNVLDYAAFNTYGGASIAQDVFIGGITNMVNTTNSIGPSTGTLVVSGGVGIHKDVVTGGNVYITNLADVSNTLNVFNTTTGALAVSGGAGFKGSVSITKGLQVASGVVFVDTAGAVNVQNIQRAAYASPTSGALNVLGGVGIGGNLILTSDTPNSGVEGRTGALVVTGGVGIGGKVFLDCSGTANATSTATGALFVQGGVGVAGNVFVTNTTASDPIGGAVAYNVPKMPDISNNALYVAGGMGVGDHVSLMKGLSVAAGNVIVDASGAVTLKNNRPVSSTNGFTTTNGALNVVGGVGIEGNVYIASNAAALVYSSSLPADAPAKNWRNAALAVASDIGVGGGICVSGGIVAGGPIYSVSTEGTTLIRSTETVDATNTSQGALLVVGGVGIGDSLFAYRSLYAAGNRFVVDHTTGSVTVNTTYNLLNGPSFPERTCDAASTSSGGLTVVGGIGTSGNVVITSTTDVEAPSVDISHSALYVAGGAGIGGSLNIAKNLSAAYGQVLVATSGAVTLLNTGIVNSTSTATGALTVMGGVGVAGVVNVVNTTSSTSSSTGALMVSGGVGIGNNLYVTKESVLASGAAIISAAGLVTLSNTSPLSTISTQPGALTVGGGVGIGGNVVVTSTTDPFAYTLDNTRQHGALVVSRGGAYIYGNSYLYKGLQVAGGYVSIEGRNTSPDYGKVVMSREYDVTCETPTSGTLTVTGGVGVGGNVVVSNTADAANGAVDISHSALYVAGGAGIGGSLNVAKNLSAAYGKVLVATSGAVTLLNTGTVTSTSTTTGALTVMGGVGVAGLVTFSNTTSSTSSSTGALMVSGGVGIGNNLYVTKETVLASGAATVSATGLVTLLNTTSGALTVAGGVGVAGLVTLSNTASSTSSSTGALTVAGGVGIGNNLYVTKESVLASGAATVSAAGLVTLSNTTSGALTVAGGMGIAGPAVVSNTTPSTNSSTGALVVGGGVGVGGDIYIKGNLTTDGFVLAKDSTAPMNINCTTDSTNTSTGALVIGGGVGIQKAVNIGGSLTVGNGWMTVASTGSVVSSTVASTSTSTGALVVAGGVGIGGTLNVNNISMITGNVVVGSALNTVINADIYSNLTVYYPFSTQGLVDLSTGLPRVNIGYTSTACTLTPNTGTPVASSYNDHGAGSNYALYVSTAASSFVTDLAYIPTTGGVSMTNGITLTFWVKFPTQTSAALPYITLSDAAGNYLKLKSYHGSNTTNSKMTVDMKFLALTYTGTLQMSHAYNVWVFHVVTVSSSGSVTWTYYDVNGVTNSGTTFATGFFMSSQKYTTVTFGGTTSNPCYVSDFRVYSEVKPASFVSKLVTVSSNSTTSMVNNAAGGLLNVQGLNVVGALNVGAVNTNNIGMAMLSVSQGINMAGGDTRVGGSVYILGDLSGCNNAVFNRNVTTGGNLTVSGVVYGDVSGSRLYNDRIVSSDISACTIRNPTITGGSATNTYLYDSYWTRGTISAAAITGGTITGTAITGGTITGTAITGGTLKNPNFSGTFTKDGVTWVGPVGPTGPQGGQGTTGPTGPQGPQGNNGSNGGQGSQGPTGPQGPQGNNGSNGGQGSQGPTGPQGPQGNNGSDASVTSSALVSLLSNTDVALNSLKLNWVGYNHFPITIGNGWGHLISPGLNTRPYASYTSSDVFAIYTPNLHPIAFLCEGAALITVIYIASDIRIKSNVEVIDTSYALNIVNQLKPSYFTYKDTTHRVIKTGFIAQEVEKLIPQSVSKRPGYVPNILSMCKIQLINNRNDCYQITLDASANLEPFDVSCNLKLACSSNSEIIVKLYDTSPDQTILYVQGTIQDSDISNGSIFVYGQEVNDFRALDPDDINTYSISAIQELTKQLTATQDELRSTRADLETNRTELGSTRAELADLQQQMALVMQKLQL